MSETFINSAVLAVSGGFQDAYTYFTRDKVFSNAQTGNVVLMSQNFMNAVAGLSDIMAEWSRTLTKILEAIAEAARKIGH